jgi:chromosome partitioning protein
MNQRNGSGKTTASANLGCMLALSGSRVLLVDFDPQASLTSMFGAPRPDFDAIKNLYDSKNPFSEGISESYEENLHIFSSSGALGSLEIEHQSSPDKTLLLKTAVDSIANDYDYIIIDTPSLLEFFITNAVRASNAVIVPVACFPDAIDTFREFKQYLDSAVYTHNMTYEYIGVFINYYSPSSRLCSKTYSGARKYHDGHMFKTRIPRCRSLAESAHARLAASAYDVTALGSVSYAKLAREVIDYVGAKAI